MRVIPKILLRFRRLKVLLKLAVIYIINACNSVLVTSTLFAQGQQFESIFEWMNVSEKQHCNQIDT
jgi:hypothetical protein